MFVWMDGWMDCIYGWRQERIDKNQQRVVPVIVVCVVCMIDCIND